MPGWPTLLAALSFFLTTNLSDPLFGNVLGVLQVLACTVGCLALPMPRNTFLTVLAKATLPPHVITALDKPLQAQQMPCSPGRLMSCSMK